MSRERILVIQTAFIGDVILATSLLETLHAAYPESALDIVVRKGNESLFVAHPYIGDVLIWNKKEGKYRSLSRLLQVIRKRKYDYVINLQRFGATGLLTAFSGAKVTIGFEKNPLSRLFTYRYPHRFEQGTHEIDRNHLLIESLVSSPAKMPRLYPTAKDYEVVAPYQQESYYCLAPASVWYTKQFPTSQWQKLIALLPENYPVYLLGGPSDEALAEHLKDRAVSGRVVSLCGRLSLLQAAALMQKAELNFVNDSAPMHLCSAIDAPVCAVYCSTVPEFGYGPLSTRSFVVQVADTLACRPCGIHGHRACPEGHFSCAMQIDVERMAGLATEN